MQRWLLLLAGTLIACGVPEADYQATLTQIDSLTAVIDELEHGAPRLLAAAERGLAAEDYATVISLTTDLLQRHPAAPEADRAESLRAEATRLRDARDASERRREAEETERAKREAEAQRRQREQRQAQAVASLYSRHDAVEGITWYYDRQGSQYVNASSRVILYFGRRGEGRPSPLQIRITYTADSWLFVEGYVFNIDGRNYRLTPGNFAIERDNGRGGIWEWYSAPATDATLEIARAIATSRSAVLRYIGDQYRRDRTITNAEKRGIQRVLDAHEALTVY